VAKKEKMKGDPANQLHTKLEQNIARSWIGGIPPKIPKKAEEITGIDGTYSVCLPIGNNQNIDLEENMMGNGERKLETTLQSWCGNRRSIKQHNHKVQAFTIKSSSGGKVAKDNTPGSLSQVREIGETCLQQRPYKNNKFGKT